MGDRAAHATAVAGLLTLAALAACAAGDNRTATPTPVRSVAPVFGTGVDQSIVWSGAATGKLSKADTSCPNKDGQYVFRDSGTGTLIAIQDGAPPLAPGPHDASRAAIQLFVISGGAPTVYASSGGTFAVDPAGSGGSFAASLTPKAGGGAVSLTGAWKC